jgi:hypothetical protein
MNTNTQSGSWLLVAVPLGVAMNLAIGLVVTTLKLPIFLEALQPNKSNQRRSYSAT